MSIPYRVKSGTIRMRDNATVLNVVLFLLVAVHLYMSPQRSATIEHYHYLFGAAGSESPWWSYVSSSLVHGSWLVLLANVYMLWLFGRELERTIGSLGILLVLFLGAVVTVGIQIITTPPMFTAAPIIGAGGVVSTILGAFLVTMPRARLDCLGISLARFRPCTVSVAAVLIAGLWFMGQLLKTAGTPTHVSGLWLWAHAGGFAMGTAVAWLLNRGFGRSATAEVHTVPAQLIDAWQKVIAGDWTGAQSSLDGVGPSSADAGADRALLDGLLSMECDGDKDAFVDSAVAAFDQAWLAQETERAITAYLQLVQRSDPERIPGIVHQNAAFAACSLQEDRLALFAINRAIASGNDYKIEQTIRSLENIYRCRRDRPDKADHCRRLLAEYYPDAAAGAQ